MIDVSQLPHLLRLVDDPSPMVRDTVAEALASFGEGLDAALDDLDPPPSADSVHAALVAAERARTISESAEADADVAPVSSAVDDDAPPSTTRHAPLFEVGQLVGHRRYGYRGIVVAVDTECRADAAWYGSNRSKPSRDQPWYHVLVHDSDQVTYAAESSLMADDSADDVRHPLLEQFFDEVGDGIYLRNSRHWPGWDQRTS